RGRLQTAPVRPIWGTRTRLPPPAAPSPPARNSVRTDTFRRSGTERGRRFHHWSQRSPSYTRRGPPRISSDFPRPTRRRTGRDRRIHFLHTDQGTGDKFAANVKN